MRRCRSHRGRRREPRWKPRDPRRASVRARARCAARARGADERGRRGRQRRRAAVPARRHRWLPARRVARRSPRGAARRALSTADSTTGFRARTGGCAMISALHNFRCRITATFYGDQALFVRRAAFARRRRLSAAAGRGHRAVAAPASNARRRHSFRSPSSPARANSSRWASGRSFARVLAILLCLRFGRKPPAAFFADIR